jgi:hypothetical protein
MRDAALRRPPYRPAVLDDSPHGASGARRPASPFFVVDRKKVRRRVRSTVDLLLQVLESAWARQPSPWAGLGTRPAAARSARSSSAPVGDDSAAASRRTSPTDSPA